VVGIGPSGREHMTELAVQAIDVSDVVIGYRGYIERIRDVICDKESVVYGMGDEIERVLHAVERVKQGNTVAIVSGGDAGVYGMASLVLEVAPPDVCVDIVPGVTSAVAAASRLGAPISLDFAVISLSDLLVPWDQIRYRAKCLAESGITTVIYNPASSKRRWQLSEIFRMFIDVRHSFYVGIVRRAFMDNERVSVFNSSEAEDDWVEMIDMLSIVFFCDTKCILRNGKLVLPRGYRL